jgi:hypothetical protein
MVTSVRPPTRVRQDPERRRLGYESGSSASEPNATVRVEPDVWWGPDGIDDGIWPRPYVPHGNRVPAKEQQG